MKFNNICTYVIIYNKRKHIDNKINIFDFHFMFVFNQQWVNVYLKKPKNNNKNNKHLNKM